MCGGQRAASWNWFFPPLHRLSLLNGVLVCSLLGYSTHQNHPGKERLYMAYRLYSPSVREARAGAQGRDRGRSPGGRLITSSLSLVHSQSKTTCPEQAHPLRAGPSPSTLSQDNLLQVQTKVDSKLTNTVYIEFFICLFLGRVPCSSGWTQTHFTGRDDLDQSILSAWVLGLQACVTRLSSE